jgi:PAS domain S-box-containing protein
LDHLPQGLAVFDRNQELVTCNKSYAEIYRLPADLTRPGTSIRAIVEHRAAQGVYSGDDPQAYVESVMDLTAGGVASTEEYLLPDGRIIFVTHRPMADGGWVSTHEDTTARKQIERQSQQQLYEQNLRLDSALENMSQGLAMFDRDGKLIICNRQYGEMYDIPAERLGPGISIKEVLELRIACGNYPDSDPQKYIDRIMRVTAVNRPTFNEFTLPNGRVLSVVHRAMPNGGWVVTQQDITERKHAELERDRAKKFLDIVIENVPAAILVREPHTLRYVLVNRAGERFIGRSRDEILGKTVYDIVPKERADRIAADDAEVQRNPNLPLLIADHVFQVSGAPDRIVTTKKLLVHGDGDEPLCLIAVIEDVTEKRAAEQEIAFLAHHDALTGLPNRTHFSQQLEEALEEVARGS